MGVQTAGWGLPKFAPKFILPIVYLEALGNPVQHS